MYGKQKQAGPVLVASGLGLCYPGSGSVLTGVSLTLSRGEKTVVLGPNGAGKTSLLLLLAGLVQGEGSVVYKGRGLEGAGEVPDGVGILFQNPADQLFCPTVYEDVAFGPRLRGCSEKEVEERVEKALALMEVGGLRAKAPHRLSAGEQKMVAMAGIFASEPDLLLLDEPNGGLDPYQKGRLAALLRGTDKTVLFTTHDLDFARRTADRALVLYQGQVEMDGSVEEILSQKGALERFRLRPPPGGLVPHGYDQAE